jgi:hypothetical protein
VRYRGSAINPASVSIAQVASGSYTGPSSFTGSPRTPITDTVARATERFVPQASDKIAPVLNLMGQFEQGGIRTGSQGNMASTIFSTVMGLFNQGTSQDGEDGPDSPISGQTTSDYLSPNTIPTINFYDLDPETRASVLDQWGIPNGVTEPTIPNSDALPIFCRGNTTSPNSGLVRGACLGNN